MFENGVIEEVQAAGKVSSTASQMIGFREIHELLDGQNVDLAMYRRDSAGNAPIRQKTVDLVSATN